MSQSRVKTRHDGFLGRITLDRPQALNALSMDMIEAIDAALIAWRDDPAIRCVLIEGAGPRGLCAGGDVRAMRQNVLDGAADRADAYLAAEYRMNARIRSFPKPYVAFMDGITMGGGVGVSAHGAHRIVTERTRLAMPEVLIGFLPDVGGTWLLSRAPNEFGTHAGLTGGSLTAHDAINCGLADLHVASERLPALAQALERAPDAEAIRRLIADHASPAEPSGFTVDGGWIARCYAGDDPQTILNRLRAAPEPAAQAAATAIEAACPMSVAASLRALRLAAVLDQFSACQELEARIGAKLLRRADFAEGVRAVVVDKDRSPRWSPSTLAAIDPEELDAVFAPAPASSRS
ncbi:enoyl-CoA hydratase/isomerase family protein [Acetobacteraceae bacterium KSS8]|uniref:3-hydroxyisobutyryl-CoA hydrolase n=1 Tax=Endosaccharibacter trunci TaxID=2812733 RepID=A0ABT1W8B5_9PROT|nr:enoyl-CoA hydratase/isomerase family protein [Acetobacteraceae bacterium KSS8]